MIDTRLGNNKVSLTFFGSVLGAAQIDWGDSSTPHTARSVTSAYSHTYTGEGINTSLVDDFQNVLDGATRFSETNYDNLLQAWSAQTVQPGVTFGADGRTFSSTGTVARQALINDNGWTFVGDSINP